MTGPTLYEKLRGAGATPQDIYSAAKAAGVDFLGCIRLLRLVFGLSLAEAKEVTVIGDGLADSLAEYQERFIPIIQQLLEEAENDIAAED